MVPTYAFGLLKRLYGQEPSPEFSVDCGEEAEQNHMTSIS
jgi:hypothetical protein